VLYWAAALYGAGNALRSAALVAYALDVLPPASRGVGIGLLRCAGDLGKGYAIVTANIAHLLRLCRRRLRPAA
jgi:hypothetical protein